MGTAFAPATMRRARYTVIFVCIAALIGMGTGFMLKGNAAADKLFMQFVHLDSADIGNLSLGVGVIAGIATVFLNAFED